MLILFIVRNLLIHILHATFKSQDDTNTDEMPR